MRYEQGFIAVTSDKWFDFIFSHDLKRVNFWCKNKAFKAILPGQPLFFLRKKSRGETGERKVVGFGILDYFELCSCQQAWDFYQLGNGFSSYSNFYEGVKEILDKDTDENLGCIILKDVTFFSKPVFLSDLNIPFQSAIVSGKKINSDEVHSILAAGGYNQSKPIECDKSEEWEKFHKEETLEEDSSNEYYEGSMVEIKLNRYERNQEARRKCIEIHGCQCKICGFDFEKVYGEAGKGFIHVHHVVPISSIKEEYRIDYEKDLIPVCPNCHAMIHRKKDSYSVEEIKEMLQMNDK